MNTVSRRKFLKLGLGTVAAVLVSGVPDIQVLPEQGAAGAAATVAEPVVSDSMLAGENILLSFPNRGGDIMPEVVELLGDFSAALQIDARLNAIQLGKALNDPVQAMGSLQRVGVAFNDSIRERIIDLMEAGQVEDSQRIILTRLKAEFGRAGQPVHYIDKAGLYYEEVYT